MAVIPLRTARTLKGWSQEELSKRSGVSVYTISDIERGKNERTSWNNAWLLAKALGVDPREIFPVPDLPAVVHQPSSLEERE